MSSMDTEKEKPSAERSSTFASRDNDRQHHPNNPSNPDSPHPQKHENDDTSLLPESSTDVESIKHNSNAEVEKIESEIKEDEDQPPTEISNIEEPSPLPPDLHKVSEEIDQYISSLSCSKDDDHDSTIPPDVPMFVEQFALLVEAKIGDYDSSDSHVKWTQLKDEDSASFLETVNRISKLSASLCQFSSNYKYAYSINRIGCVLQRAMSYLEEEFQSLLEDHRILDHSSDANIVNESKPPPKLSVLSNPPNQDGEQTPAPAESDPPEENNSPHEYSEEVLSHLNKLTNAMIGGGYEEECCQVYFIARRNALEESLHKSGFEKHSIDEVQRMNWESLEREIVAWIKTFKQCMNVQLPNERKLSDVVFLDYPVISQSLFNSLSRVMILQLLNFSEAVAMTKRAAEKLFKFLDIYETLRDVLPTLEKLFLPECADEIKSDSSLTRSRLGEAMICVFTELENSIKADTGKTPVPGGAVHPLTLYIMNYLRHACQYKDTLEQVFREHKKIERADSATGSDFDYNSQAQDQNSQKAQSPFQMQLTKVMDLLDANLEVKSKLYRDLSLSSIFMMNNGRYILQKIKGSTEVNQLMGSTWCRKRSSELRQYHKNYQRETWGRPLHCLMNQEGLNVNGKVMKPVLKERFKSFNAMFDEIHKTQSVWVVGDEQLQSELRVSISNMVIPAYRAFLARYGQIMTPGRQTEKYVKYQPEDIETFIDELFDGNAPPMGKKKS